MGKNFVFISPTFPKTYYQFPQAWKRIGGTSLCIGEDYYDSLSEEMKNACDEYYRVDNMQDYDQMYRAVAWFAHKHGKIDWLESNNEFWLKVMLISLQTVVKTFAWTIIGGDPIKSR